MKEPHPSQGLIHNWFPPEGTIASNSDVLEYPDFFEKDQRRP